MGLTVIIPTKTTANVTACLDAIYQHAPETKQIIVDDGIEPIEIHDSTRIIQGEKPFIFSRNVNLGIKAAGKDDIIVLNDDAILTVPGGFRAMRRMAVDYPEYGIISASANNVGNPNQFKRSRPTEMIVREEPRMVCFVCVLIPRRTIDRVGLMDERYVGYGLDDDDYCLQVRKAGLKIGIFDGCFVDHARLTSTYRSKEGGADFKPNLKLFVEKWGTDNMGLSKDASKFPECFPPREPFSDENVRENWRVTEEVT